MNLWFVIETKPKKEAEASSCLCTAGVEMFHPLIEMFASRNMRMSKE